MLMDNNFEYGVPYVNYQFLKRGKEFWEVCTPADLVLNSIKIHHWQVLGDVRFDWAGYIEVKLYEMDKDYTSWERVELLSMGHLLKSHFFKTKEEAEEYKKWYLEQQRIEGR